MTSSVRSRLLAQRSLLLKMQQGGFTLVELLVVVIILGILAAIAIPAFLNQQNRARISAGHTVAMDAARACAALQVTGDEAKFVVPANVAAAVCNAAGAASAFTSNVPGLTQQAAATVAADGSTALTQCATAPGFTTGAAPDCKVTAN